MDDQIETEDDLARQEGDEPSAIAHRWITEITLFERKREDYESRAKKIIRRYRDERESSDKDKTKFNILWANIETLKPTVYAETPTVSVSKRFKDADPVSRVASLILERAVDTLNDQDDRFSDTMLACRDDLLLVGNGFSWCRYVPHFVTPDPIAVTPPEFMVESEQESAGYTDAKGNIYPDAEMGDDGQWFHQPPEQLETEEAIDEYIDWRDFGWNAGARRWNEVYAVWRKAYMTKDELTERFGVDIAGSLQLDNKPDGIKDDDKASNLFSKATVYEIWDKSSGRVYWINKGHKDGPLDMMDDPLGLSDFFPCPRPMFGTLTNDSLIPVPDYAQYQDQAEEIDELTIRINKLTDAVRLRGVYAGGVEEIKQLLSRGDADLVPIQDWQQLAGIGGIEKAIAWVPLADVAQALLALYDARERAKQDLYEVTGLSDIIRGASDAGETATAQAIKAQWGSVRVRDKQKAAARFARDHIRIKAEIVAEHFDPETIKRLAQTDGLPEQDQALVDDAIQMIRDDRARSFNVDIETDSTVAADEQADKESRIEFMTALTSFMQQWGPMVAQAPELLPLAQEALLFAVRGFKVGEQLESAIEQTMQALSQRAQVPQQPQQPDPTEVVKAEAEKMKAEAGVMQAQTSLQEAQVEAQSLPLRLQGEVAQAMGANGMGVM
jgi:hypothetical protein